MDLTRTRTDHPHDWDATAPVPEGGCRARCLDPGDQFTACWDGYVGVYEMTDRRDPAFPMFRFARVAAPREQGFDEQGRPVKILVGESKDGLVPINGGRPVMPISTAD